MTSPHDHYRPTTDDYERGVYRVVGTGEEVTLLRVADGDGRRIHAGELEHVDAAAVDDAFEPAEDPDAGVSPVTMLRNALQGLYWTLRNPLP
jgi:hypothetical protein